MIKKTDDMFSGVDRIPACDGQTDGQTDILRRHTLRYAYASRCKNAAKYRYASFTWRPVRER